AEAARPTGGGWSLGLVPRPLADHEVDAGAVREPPARVRALREHVVLQAPAREAARDRAGPAVVAADRLPRPRERPSDHVRDHAGRPERWRRWRRWWWWRWWRRWWRWRRW